MSHSRGERQGFRSTFFGLSDNRQGIVHINRSRAGLHPSWCYHRLCDSHTSTHGAFGALAFGIGTSEVEHVLATQTILQKRAKNMLIQVDGELTEGVTSKDIILHIIGVIGTAGGTGHVIEFAGSAFALSPWRLVCPSATCPLRLVLVPVSLP